MEIINPGRRKFLITLAAAFSSIATFFSLFPFISALRPTKEKTLLAGPMEVDISQLEPGQMLTVLWQGKPIWILRRTAEMVYSLKTDNSLLRDPDSKVPQQPPYADNFYRSIYPEYFVAVGVCTHLGCIPLLKPKENAIKKDWPGGFACPCHGSLFDLAGRVFKGVPAPINLEIPPYYFLNDKTIVIGAHANHVS
jgi:ubiquinol-cytochrome c reductase iron-sulfur subunit